jgi:hypothetical protein
MGLLMAFVRTVEQFAAEVITFYRGPAPGDLVGQRLRGELVAAGFPAETAVVRVDGDLVVGVRNDPVDRSSSLESVVAAHQGSQHAEEVAARQLVAAAVAAMQRLNAAAADDPVVVGDVRPVLRVLLRLNGGG